MNSIMRVWNPRLKQMSEPFTVDRLLGNEIALLHKSNIEDGLEWLTYTPFRDSFDKEICEDDILHFRTLHRDGVVRWDDRRGLFWVYLKGYPDSNKKHDGSLFDFMTSIGWCDHVEIIGNAWQNAELM